MAAATCPLSHLLDVPATSHPPLALQLDSLVRIGASMASPDQHLRGTAGGSRPQSPVEVVQQLLPPGWEQAVAQLDNSINPLRSNANAQAFLSELHAEWLRQSCGGGGGQGQRAGGEPPGYDFYTGAKFPGAGTWVRWAGTGKL